jgi:hypothetical protein
MPVRERRTVGSIISLTAILLIPAGTAKAHNKWQTSYRKWPWKVDQIRTLNTLPGESPHSGQSNQLAIDVLMSSGERVYSITPGITSYEFDDCVGNYMVVQDSAPAGRFHTYEHLNSSLVGSGGAVSAGQPIVTVGTAASATCGTGSHLHFQRSSQLGAYTDDHTIGSVTKDFVHWIGFPTGNGFESTPSGGTYRQNFQNGYILYMPGICRTEVYLGTTFTKAGVYCD